MWVARQVELRWKWLTRAECLGAASRNAARSRSAAPPLADGPNQIVSASTMRNPQEGAAPPSSCWGSVSYQHSGWLSGPAAPNGCSITTTRLSRSLTAGHALPASTITTVREVERLRVLAIIRLTAGDSPVRAATPWFTNGTLRLRGAPGIEGSLAGLPAMH